MDKTLISVWLCSADERLSTISTSLVPTLHMRIEFIVNRFKRSQHMSGQMLGKAAFYNGHPIFYIGGGWRVKFRDHFTAV